jgi:hypothetical protein
MKVVSIPKKTKGKFRTIYIPDQEEMAKLRALAGGIEIKSRQLCAPEVVHGFTRLKSPVTNASQHVGYSYSLCFDLADFFDTVTEIQLRGKLTKEELKLVLVDGAARQGLPTSPAVANIAAADMDQAILKWRDKNKYEIVYTRYADDLTFSYNNYELTEALKKAIPQIASRCGFKINPNKTHLVCAKQGRRIITGVGVGEEGIYPTRDVKRKLRAAVHQKHRREAMGLAEWCKLKLPRETPVVEYSRDDILAVLQAWNLPKVSLKRLPKKDTVYLSEEIVISGDPIYMLGMSTWTNGWTSCMAQPNGRYRKGVMFWTFLHGTRLATMLSEKVKVFGGVERRIMRARTLVHELRNGVICHDRVYGNYPDTDKLQEILRSNGILPVWSREIGRNNSGKKVKGYAPMRFSPYFDNLRSDSEIATFGFYKGKKVRIAKI